MHPPYDCEDCGRLHGAWSAHERRRREREEELAEHGEYAKQRWTRLHSITTAGVPLYVEVEEPGIRPVGGGELPF